MNKSDRLPSNRTSLNDKEAAIVFFRPVKFVGGKVSTYIFEPSGNAVKFVAALSQGKKIFFLTTPGKHMFASRAQSMFGSRNGLLLEGVLEPTKIYYIEASVGLIWPIPNPLDSEVERKIKACEWDEDQEGFRLSFIQNQGKFCSEYNLIEKSTAKDKAQDPNKEVAQGICLDNYMILPTYGIEEII